jgi:hypothetical protein
MNAILMKMLLVLECLFGAGLELNNEPKWLF